MALGFKSQSLKSEVLERFGEYLVITIIIPKKLSTLILRLCNFIFSRKVTKIVIVYGRV